MAPSTAEKLITVCNLTRWYPENPHTTFEKFNFSLMRHDFRILIGKSGTGKTSLAKLLIGQLIPPPHTIFYRQEDLANYSEDDREAYRKKIWIVFQDYRLLEQATVKENIAYPLQIFWLGESVIETQVDVCIKKCDLRHIINTPIHLLSVGEKQKVCLARALIHSPEFIIADEPTGNLDREATQTVADMLIDANKEGNAVLLITHDVHLLYYLKEHHTVQIDILK